MQMSGFVMKGGNFATNSWNPTSSLVRKMHRKLRDCIAAFNRKLYQVIVGGLKGDRV